MPAFIQQTTVDSLVELALNSVDKPDLVAGPPTTLGRFVELYGVEPVRRALARCQQLVETNPSDFTAAGAIKFLEDALEAVQLADR